MQRDTRQRRAMRRVFMSAGRPLTPEEILEHGQQIVPSLGLATVYRYVKTLTADAWLAEVELPGGGVRYELAERPHHHHFLCRSCDQAFDVHRCPDEIEELAPDGFQVDSHELILYGRCAACA
ncbi:MAG: transcriptional repressor [Gemmatimonadota bacterium]|nr:transcriptional repressor [Gemmatimonadota bacterium]MDE3006209.1 transcriptional repressor [Gemmatimonadota bacterium]MDE3015098.1 transcriptional repressor [Gemmatimonadota bacterium]